jgi:hypothetical protein
VNAVFPAAKPKRRMGTAQRLWRIKLRLMRTTSAAVIGRRGSSNLEDIASPGFQGIRPIATMGTTPATNATTSGRRFCLSIGFLDEEVVRWEFRLP